MSVKVFIDGAEGTTGLRIHQRLQDRRDITILPIDPALRKDPGERARLSNQADIVFLCLPDQAAREAVAAITNPTTRVIDPSTAHRTSDGWTYGLPELSATHREAIIRSKRVSNPGCYATGFITLTHPLVKEGVAPADYPFTCHAISGYSGAGRAAIEKYESPDRPVWYGSPRQYALGQQHKHLPEMQKISGTATPPIFNPVIADFYAGMLVTVPIYPRLLRKKMDSLQLRDLLAEYYRDQKLIRVREPGAQDAFEGSMLDAGAMAGSDALEIFVCGHQDQIVLIARFDNLGKGASGAAIQNMNLLCGFDEVAGLVL